MGDLLGKMPIGWVRADLADFVPSPKSDIVDGPFGSNLKAIEYTASGTPIIRLQNIDRNRFLNKNIKFVNDDKARELARHNFEPLDIVITKLGAPLGKAALVPSGFGPGIIVADVVRCRVDERYANRKYVMFAINSPSVSAQLALETKGTTRPRVNLKHVRSLRLPMAPRNQQDRIVEKIETLFAQLDKGEEALREVQRLLARYRQSVLNAAVTGRLTESWRSKNANRLEHGRDLLERILQTRRRSWQGRGRYKEPAGPDTTNLPELPDGWVWASLSQLTYIKGGVTVDKKREASNPVTLPYMRVANVQNGFLDLSEIKEITVNRDKAEQCLLQPGDILLNEGGDRDKLGRGWIWNGEIAPCIHQNHVFRARPVIQEISSKFISYYANAFGQPFFMKKGKQSVNLASISLTAISTLPIPLPSAKEQGEIVTAIEREIERIETVAQATGTELARSTALRQSILKDAFEGHLVPQDPADEPAAELLARIRESRVATPAQKKHKSQRKTAV